MSWPLSQDYNEAVQSPRTSFSDADLKTGEAVANALGIPMPRSGNFADVYEVRCPDGGRWAVKCFTREVHGLRERYQEISSYLRQAQLPFTVDFQYLEQGIRVRGQWFPILKMQWVEGFVLNEFVRANLDKKPILQAMSQIWLRMARRLRETNIAHGDLQHGNVMLVPGSTAKSLAVKLIDYDGMCVPALVGQKSGEVGHPAYQHPERLRTGAYNRDVDRFSLLCIAAALRCLTFGGRSLWERYDNGDNLLFQQADLQKPTESPLFQELLAIRDPLAQSLVKELYRACQGPLDAVPLLTDLLPEEKPATKVTLVPSAGRPADVQEPDWDFGEDEPGSAIVKKRTAAGKRPLWIWGAVAGAAAILLLGVGVAVGLVLHKGGTEKTGATLTQNKPEVTVPNPKPKPADAGNPESVMAKQTESDQPTARVRTVYLADLREMNVTALSFAKRDGSKVKNVTSPNDLFLHPPDNGAAQVSFSLGKQYRRFKATVGIRDGTNGGLGSGTPLTFRVLGDEKELWKSAPIQQCGQTRDCAVSVAGVERLELQVQCPGTAYCAHAVWVEPRLEEVNPPRNSEQIADAPWDFPLPERIFQLAPAGDMLAISAKGDKVWRLVKPRGKKMIREFRGHEGAISAAAFSDDGTRIVTGGHDKQMIVWDVKTGGIVRLIRSANAPLVSVALSADGKRVVGTDITKNVTVWDLESGRGHTYNLPSNVISVGFAPNGQYLLCGLENSRKGTIGDAMFAWPLAPKRNILVFHAPSAPVTCIAASPDGKYVALGHSGESPAVSLWQAQPSKLLWRAPAPARLIHQLIFSPDGRFLLTAAGDHFQVWRVGSKLETAMSGGDVNQEQVSAAFAPDSRSVTFAYGRDDLSFAQSVRLPGAGVVETKPPARPRPGRVSNKRPVPDEKALAEARQQVRAKFKDAYDRAAGQRELAKQLYDAGYPGFNAPALQYAYLSESSLVAARAGDLSTALDAVNQLGRRFDVSLLELKCAALEQAQEAASKPVPSRAVAQKALLLVDRGLMTEEYDRAERLLKVARLAAAKADIKKVLEKSVEQAARRLEQMRGEYEKVKSAARILEDKPDDPEANLLLGTFRCVHKGDWEGGLPLLAKGSDKALADLAEKDLADTADAAEQAKLGDGWYDLAAKTTEKKVKSAWQLRAYPWYQDAFSNPKLSKSEQTRLRGRLQELITKLPELSKVWHELDISGATPIRTGTGSILRLRPHHTVATRQWYERGIDVTVVALLAPRPAQPPRPSKNHLRLTLLNGGELAVTLTDTKVDYTYYQPFGDDPDGTGLGPSRSATYVTAGEPLRLRYRVTPGTVDIWINDKQIFGHSNANWKMNGSAPVRIWSDDCEADIASVIVKRIHEK